MGFAAFNAILDYFGSNFTMRKLHITELNRKHIEEFKSSKKWPVRILLDNVRSLHNIGSVFRTADAFLVEENQFSINGWFLLEPLALPFFFSF